MNQVPNRKREHLNKYTARIARSRNELRLGLLNFRSMNATRSIQKTEKVLSYNLDVFVRIFLMPQRHYRCSKMNHQRLCKLRPCQEDFHFSDTLGSLFCQVNGQVMNYDGPEYHSELRP